MSRGLIDPKATAQAAIRAGLLLTSREVLALNSPWPKEEFDYEPRVKLPAEIGLAREAPPPKKPRKKYHHVPIPKRYVITRKDRPELYARPS